jgi:hypothetical protein
MNLKKLAVVFSILCLGLIFASSMNKGSKTRAAAPCAVPSGSYPTIQSAASDPGCTQINVAAGAYNETVNVNFSTTISGAQAGNNDFITRNANPAGESTVNGSNPTASVGAFNVNAANVTIDGFTVKHTVTSGAAMGITVGSGGNGAAILNNIIDTIVTPDTGGQGTAQAVYLLAGPDNVNIENNEMKNIQSNRSAKGVLVGDNGTTTPSLNLQIKDNSIHDVTSTTRGAYGISVANVNPGTANLKVLNNNISYLTGGGWVHAVGLEGDTPSAVVNGNSISNVSSPGPDVVAVWFESNPSFNTAVVKFNNLDVSPAYYGIAVQPSIPGTGSVDGTCNWWGAPNGPGPVGSGAGSRVSPRVKYSPWSTAPEPNGNCGGMQATNKDQCKDGGWQFLFRANGTGFKNQGDCIQYVNTGK